MNDLLELLKEALEQLVNIWKVADDSIADYTLNIETAINFINRALKTQDRLDIFKALQKAHDVLEKEDEEDELVNRLQDALNGLNENVFMKESELKTLIKMVLKEIYMEPEPEHPLAQILQKLSKAVQGSNPAFVDISKGHEMAHRIVAAIIADIKSMIKSSVGNQKDEFSKGVQAFEAHSSSLMNFIIGWAQQIHAEHPETDEQLDRVMHEFKDHLNQIGAQFKEVFVNLRQKNDLGKKNVINSVKQLEHLNEIFNGLRESIDALFQVGLSVGYGKKK